MSTPVQRQYTELKNQNPDAILFFRLGDFYEMFHEDAQVAARILGIALTARHKGTENEMPMCGFPYHSHEPYLEQLVNAGYKVAIAEQQEVEPGKIIRVIDRVVTPGTSLEDGNSEEGRNSFLLALGRGNGNKGKGIGESGLFALAYSDLGTGEFRTAQFEDEISFLDELWKLNPKEILIPEGLFVDEAFCAKLPQTHLTVQPDLKLDSAEELLKKQFGVSSLDGFGLSQLSLLIEVAGLVVKYLSDTQKTELKHIKKITKYSTDEFMQLDAQTMQHLEIFRPIYGDEGATLFSVFERPGTPMGGRKLFQWVANPLLRKEDILKRHEAVEELVKEPEKIKRLKEVFGNISDLERLLARLVTGKGNARDLVVLRNGISVFGDLQEICNTFESLILKRADVFEGFESLTEKLQAQLVDAPPLNITEGGMFRDGVHEKLDELRSLSRNAEEWLEAFLNTEKERSGISNVRVKYSKNFGFCLEVSKAQASSAPENWTRRQTLVNAERFTTPELAEYESKVLGAESEANELEHQMFLSLREEVLSLTDKIQVASQGIGVIDALLIFARTAQKNRWNRPEIVGEAGDFVIKDGRHPVVEKLSEEPFIANDLGMRAESNFHLITGPNMAGKSTYLRQNAVIILLAQIGSFVPANKVSMPVFDRIFTRVGASDNLAGGKSTFYVEMAETARILNCATDRSFIILDEIGRGTSTFDGLSLAWAITEYLHDAVGCKTLFATHYHELIDLADELASTKNYHVSVSQNKDGIVFLRKILEGGIADSFGIEVAKSAGIPASVIEQARDVLTRLESENLLSGTPNLFSTPRVVEKVVEKDSEVEKKLSEIDPDQLSPKEALEVLYDLKDISE